ncbi:MAG: DNA polymerase III subunit gamma/tau [bacterium]|nr:DNA polymerase III subunit gamma/tau [bacterium]
MSYLVLARKWRPQSFEDIVGQEHVTRTLKNAISSERVAHAYLFTGARGVGKTSAARILAKALNCEKGPTVQPCNECTHCREIASGASVDVHEIDGASNTSVDDVRDLKEGINYLPSSCRKKIYIIDEVHMLSTSAFNALLKTLEEPPSHVIFIFATTEPHKIPGTILSRCQRFDFKRIPVRLIYDRLKGIASEEKLEISEKSLMIIAREADGGMRDAQSLLDQVISFSGSSISDEDVIDVLGVIDLALIQEAAVAVLNNDPGKCLELVERLFTYGWDVKEFGRELLEYLRNLAVLKVAPDSVGLIESTIDEIDRMKSVVADVNLESLHLYFDVMARGMEDVLRALHPKVSLEMLLLKLAMLGSLRDIDKLLDAVKTQADGSMTPSLPSRKATLTPAAPLNAPDEKPESPPIARSDPEEYQFEPAPLEDFASHADAPVQEVNKKKDWNGFVALVKTDRKPLGSILESAHLESMDADIISIAFEESFSIDRVSDGETLDLLQGYAKEYFGKERVFKVGSLQKDVEKINSIHEERKKKESDLSRKLKKEAEEHPLVMESLAVFQGNIKEIKTELNFNE